MSPLEVAGYVAGGAAAAALCVCAVLALVAWWLRRGVTLCTCAVGGALRGRVAMVTGANAGIGLEVARGLAQRGARVLLACRDASRGAAAASTLRHDVPGADVRVVTLDLADLTSVRACAEHVARSEGRLDVLVNNAGVYGRGADRLTPDGIVEAMQVNHFGPFLLTLLVLPLLRAAPDGRVAFVSSLLHHLGTVGKPERLNEPGRYWSLRAYANGKLCNVSVAAELARRGVAAYSVHPGIVVTGLTASSLRVTRALFAVWAALCRRSAREAAACALHVVSRTPPPSPGYYTECRPACSARGALRPAPRLWALSERLVRYNVEAAQHIQRLADEHRNNQQTILSHISGSD